MTRQGVGVLLSGLVALATGWALGSEVLVGLGLSAEVLVVVALLWIARRPRLRLHREIDPVRVPRGEVALGRLVVTNRTRLTSVSVRAVERGGSEPVEIHVDRMRPGGSVTKTYELPTGVRGRFVVGPLEVTREDPFGLARRVQEQGTVETFWVHPRHHPVTVFPRGRSRSLDGREAPHLRSGSVAFHALRDYVLGDDLRRVHWRSSARRGQLMVREMVDTAVPVVTVLVDTRSAAYSRPPGEAEASRFEDALEVAASLVVAGAEERIDVRVRTTCGRHRDVGSAPSQAAADLDLLAELVLLDEVDLSVASHDLRRDRQQDTLVLVTGAPDAAELAALLGLRTGPAAAVVVAVNGGGPVAVPRSDIRTLGVTDAADFALRWPSIAG